VAVTNGAQHLRSLRDLIERAAQVSTPGWRIRPPTGSAFTLENAAAQLGVAFGDLACVRPPGASVIIRDASVAAEYVSSLAGHYQPQVARPWMTTTVPPATATQPSDCHGLRQDSQGSHRP
jgi:hypothetical protein